MSTIYFMIIYFFIVQAHIYSFISMHENFKTF